jgi:hypothetical protein
LMDLTMVACLDGLKDYLKDCLKDNWMVDL